MISAVMRKLPGTGNELVPLRPPVLVGAENSDLDWIASDGVPSGWVVLNTEPIIQRFMDPQHRVILQLWIEPKLLVDDLRAFFRDLRGCDEGLGLRSSWTPEGSSRGSHPFGRRRP